MPDPVVLLDRGELDTSSALSSRAGKTITVVDDSESVRDSLRVLLEAEGFVVHDFASGMAFVRSGLVSHCDCVIVDLVMPIMSGLDVIEDIRARGCQIPIIIVTGHSKALAARAAASAFAVIDKPFAAEVLVRAVLEALGLV